MPPARTPLPPAPLPQRAILRNAEVTRLTGLSSSQRWRLEQRGEFPARVKLTPSGMAIGYFDTEIFEFINNRPRTIGKQPPLPKSRRPATAEQEEPATRTAGARP